MSNELEADYIGRRLLERGFTTWFKHMFKVVENRAFTIEPLHPELFDVFGKLYTGEEKRVTINVPPRSAKTTLAKYFIAYTWTLNPCCNFIYTSYSEDLLKSIAKELVYILEHPIYKAMYPQTRYFEDSEIVKPTDDFWVDYLFKATGKNTYSSKKITTYAGGTCLFSAMGAQITGYGAGIRNSKGFSGALILDDPNKPADMRSQTMREKVLRFYEETLLSRLNNSNVPIINIQQRLHVEDLSGLLDKKYHFHTLCKPLIDENGVCQLPTQYTEERIKELQSNNYMFSAQYQQQPYILGGQVIKRTYFRYYSSAKQYNYKRILITADTAMKVKEHNDYSVFIVGGITNNNELHILDLVRGKWEAPELEKMAVMMWEKYKRNQKTGLTCSGLYIEDKASGVGLIQGLKSKFGIPVFGIQVSNDKLTRVENALPYLEAGQVYLPENEFYAFNPDLLAECEAFSRDMSHLHDDQVDTLCHLIQEGLAKTTVSLLDYFM